MKTFLKESAIPRRAQRAQWTDAACADVVNRGKNCAASGSGRVVLITYIDDDHCERNWLSLAVDQSGQLAAFQSLGEGALPRGVGQSLEDAEAIDEFIDKVNQA